MAGVLAASALRGEGLTRDRQTGTTARASVDSAGTQGNNGSWNPSISGDGRYVAFESNASNGKVDIFVRRVRHRAGYLPLILKSQ